MINAAGQVAFSVLTNPNFPNATDVGVYQGTSSSDLAAVARIGGGLTSVGRGVAENAGGVVVFNANAGTAILGHDSNGLHFLVIFVGSVVVILAASEIGRQLGARATEGGGTNVATLQGAILGLLALTIGFTFAMALSRFDARRDGVLNEANAIGTTALRARLLPAPHNTESLKLLREYVQLRLDFAQHVLSPQEQAAALARSNAIQEALWQEATAVAAKDTAMVPTGLFIQTLNEMIDNQQKRLTALRNHVPTIVLLALYATAIIASAFTGYASGLETRRSRVPMYVMGVLVAAVILLIQDLDRPGKGFVTVSQQPMIDTAASLAGYQE